MRRLCAFCQAHLRCLNRRHAAFRKYQMYAAGLLLFHIMIRHTLPKFSCQTLHQRPSRRSACSWTLRVTGQPMRGKELNDQPASVRVVTEAKCYGQTALDFWANAFGCSISQCILKRGHVFALTRSTFCIRVQQRHCCLGRY